MHDKEILNSCYN